MDAAFELWFQALLLYARERGEPDLIDRNSPETYMEYFDDGDDIATCFEDEYDARGEEN